MRVRCSPKQLVNLNRSMTDHMGLVGRQTDTTESITLTQLRWREVRITKVENKNGRGT